MKISHATLVLCLLFFALPSAFSLQINGVEVPPQVTVNGQSLALNGAGLRTVSIAFIPIKAYVAAFYSPSPLKSEEAVLASPGPLQFTFTFLKSVNQGQVTDAWQSQIQASMTYSYPGIEKDKASFIGMFGPIAQGGSEMVQLIGTQTQIYDNGQLKGVIPGRDFQKAFLSMWFGSTPVQQDLKTALLRN
ncbi:MAG: chalcone isomerase family protein [bacterium]